MGIKKGFLLAVFDFFSFIISIYLARFVYPFISKMLLSSTTFTSYLKKTIETTINVEGVVKTESLKAQTDFINSLPLPKILLNSINENNNNEIYKILNVNSLQEYIVNFMTNICINILAMIISFIAVFIIMKILVSTLDVLTKLPVIKTFNTGLGGCVGFLQGIVVIWVLMMGITFFLSRDNGGIISSLNSSYVAIWFYENNLLMNMVVKIFA